jgi:hypothetical protein
MESKNVVIGQPTRISTRRRFRRLLFNVEFRRQGPRLDMLQAFVGVQRLRSDGGLSSMLQSFSCFIHSPEKLARY